MKTIFNFLFSILIGCWMTIATMSNETVLTYEWIGIAIGISMAYFICSCLKNRIDILEEEIKKLKNEKENNNISRC